MRILPCSPTVTGRHACADGHAKMSGGVPYYSDHWLGPQGAPFRYRCQACGNLMTITATTYNSLPNVRYSDAPPILATIMMKSMRFGGAVSAQQARDLLLAGFESQAEVR